MGVNRPDVSLGRCLMWSLSRTRRSRAAGSGGLTNHSTSPTTDAGTHCIERVLGAITLSGQEPNAIAELHRVLPKHRCPPRDSNRFQDKAASTIGQHALPVEGQRSKTDLVVVGWEHPHICCLPLRLDGRVLGPPPAAGSLSVETDVHRAFT